MMAGAKYNTLLASWTYGLGKVVALPLIRVTNGEILGRSLLILTAL